MSAGIASARANEMALMEKRLVGICVNADFLKEEIPTEQAPKIRNYGVIAPYGGMGSKRIVHGRMLFPTEESFARFEESGEVTYSSDLLSDVMRYFLPESYEERKEEFRHQKYAEIERQLAEKRYPGNVGAFTKEQMLVLGRLKPVEEDVRETTLQQFYEWKVKLENGDEYAQEFYRRHAEPLAAYLEAHHYDWQIMENMEAAHSSGATSIEALMQEGARIRAEQAIHDAAKQMANPYHPVFEMAEARASKQIAANVEPAILKEAIDSNIPVLVTEESTLKAMEHAIGYQTDANGLFHFSQRDKLGNSFILLACPGLEDGWREVAPHEYEHCYSYLGGLHFYEDNREKLPVAIERDRIRFETLRQRIDYVSSASPSEEQELLFLTARRGGIEVSSGDIEGIKRRTKYQLDLIADGLRLFMPELRHGRIAMMGDEESAYHGDEEIYEEIPSILSELSNRHGGDLVKQLVPELHGLWMEHRRQFKDPAANIDTLSR